MSRATVFDSIFYIENNEDVASAVISGGFEQLILPYMEILKIPIENVYCKPEIIESIASSGKLEEEAEKSLTEIIIQLKENFKS